MESMETYVKGLSQMLKIFDPIGIATEVITTAKIEIQRMCQLGLSCHNVLQSVEEARWRKLFHEIQQLDRVAIPRHLS